MDKSFIFEYIHSHQNDSILYIDYWAKIKEHRTQICNCFIGNLTSSKMKISEMHNAVIGVIFHIIEHRQNESFCFILLKNESFCQMLILKTLYWPFYSWSFTETVLYFLISWTDRLSRLYVVYSVFVFHGSAVNHECGGNLLWDCFSWACLLSFHVRQKHSVHSLPIMTDALTFGAGITFSLVTLLNTSVKANNYLKISCNTFTEDRTDRYILQRTLTQCPLTIVSRMRPSVHEFLGHFLPTL